MEHHFETVLENAPEAPTFYTGGCAIVCAGVRSPTLHVPAERVVVNLLRFAIRLVPSAVLISRLLKLLALLPKLSRQTLARMGDRIGAGIVLFLQVCWRSVVAGTATGQTSCVTLQTRGDEINQGWPAIFSLLNRYV